MKKPARVAGHDADLGLAQVGATQRHPGPGGGATGGPAGVRRGSMGGAGSCRLNGLMMIGGMAGGADGGSLGPLMAIARWSRIP